MTVYLVLVSALKYTDKSSLRSVDFGCRQKLLLRPNQQRSSKYVDFFGIQPDSDATDPDGDGLSNYEESLLWTDAFTADTDKDGFTDNVDTNPVSRITQ